MKLPEQLRAIADRLEAAEAEKAAALDELWQIRTVDSAAGLVPAEEHQPAGEAGRSAEPAAAPDAGVVQVATTPARHAGDAGSSPGTRSNTSAPAETTCSDCGRSFAKPHGLEVHRVRAYGKNWSTKPERNSPAARLAKRDAARANPPPRVSIAPAAGVTRPGGNGAAPVIRKGVETFLCSRCPESFRTREALETHLLLKHPDAEPRRLPVGQAPPRSEYEAADRVLRGGGLLRVIEAAA